MRKLTKLFAATAMLWPLTSWSAHGFNSVYNATFKALNSSGVNGDAVLAFSGGDTLRVIVQANNLTPNQSHALHIHGLSDAEMAAVCPDLSADSDGDNLISVAEGLPFYGDPQLGLNDDDGNAPAVGADGRLAYSQTITLGENGAPDLAGLGNPGNRVIVLHGLAFNNGSYVANQPVACAKIDLAVLQIPPEVDETPPASGNGSSGALGWGGLLIALLALGGLRRRD